MPEPKPRKTKYWSRTSPNVEWDYVVIGSGMGGMTTAALLAKLGRRVLLCEQHYVPGGFTHAFPRKGYTWDVGVHAIGEVTKKSMTGRLLARLTDGRLEWSSLGPVYDEFYFPEGFKIGFPDSPHQFRTNLVEAFPDEEEAIDKYVLAVREVASTMKGYHLARAAPRRLVPAVEWLLAKKARRFLDLTTREVIEGLTENPRLRTIFAAQWGYYGAAPSRASFAVQALVVKHFLYGGYYPVGGSGEIARCLLKTVADAGGWTRILADVDEILIEKERAAGVRLRGGEEIRARKVVSATSAVTTLCRLLPEKSRDPGWDEAIAGLAPGPAHVCLYLGFKGDITRAGAGAANKWFYNTWNTEDEVWRLDDPESLDPAPLLYCSFPSLKDPRHDPGPELRHTGEVVTFVPWSAFAPWHGTERQRRGADYKAFKGKLEAELSAQFFAKMPELRPMLDYVELSTPVSTDYFCRPYAGSIYGLEPTPARFKTPLLRPRSPIRRLYLSGSDVAMGGVMGAMLGGLLAAVAAEPVAALRFLRRI